MMRPRALFMLLLVFILCGLPLAAQGAPQAKTPVETAAAGAPVETVAARTPAGTVAAGAPAGALETLSEILQSIQLLQMELRQKEAEYVRAETEDKKARLAGNIRILNVQLDARGREFDAIAAGFDMAEAAGEEAFDFKREAMEVVRPLIEELKKVTKRPREIERLRKQLAEDEKTTATARAAAANLDRLLAADDGGDADLKLRLSDLRQEWMERERESRRRITTLRYQLDQKLAASGSAWHALRTGARGFFQTRGLNILMAVALFLVIFGVMRFAYWRIYRISQGGDGSDTRSFYHRLFQTLYHILTFLISIGAALFLLYNTGDWLLLSIVIILLLGMAWAARNAFSMFWEQSKFLLNVGTVREGERMVYDGIPWKVAALNIQTALVNPALRGGLIRLPLKSLVGLQSRPFDPEESWFPSREGDFLLLADGQYGKVLTQTPEMVTMEVMGGCRKTYPTADFLSQTPINLSLGGFGLAVTFGIGYGHLAAIARKIPEQLRERLEAGIAAESFGPQLKSLLVEFKEAGASSLDLLIWAGFTGEAASSYWAIGRAIQRITVEACNEHGWDIPFPQITVHQAAGLSRFT